MKRGKPVPIQHLARIRALQMLYKLDIGPNDDADQLVLECEWLHELPELAPPELSARELRKIESRADALVAGVTVQKHLVDEMIAGASPHWDTARMLTVDLNTIRLALYEMFYADVPPAVCINEAVEIARLFGDEESWRFTNGILDQIRRDAAADVIAIPPAAFESANNQASERLCP